MSRIRADANPNAIVLSTFASTASDGQANTNADAALNNRSSCLYAEADAHAKEALSTNQARNTDTDAESDYSLADRSSDRGLKEFRPTDYSPLGHVPSFPGCGANG